MTLTRKNNALTNDVVSMYDAVEYGETVGQAIQQMSPPPGGGGLSMPEEAPVIVKAAILIGYGIYSFGKWLFG